MLERANEHEVAELRLKVLDLPSVIESKEIANREKDHAVLPVLRHTLEERDRTE